MRCLVAALLIAAVAGCATSGHRTTMSGSGTADAPIDTTIESVKANPAPFEDKYIRLRGLVYCWHVACSLLAVAPGTVPVNSRPTSLSLGFGADKGTFDADAPAPRYYLEDVEIGGALRDAYVFSEATVVGRYSSLPCGDDTHTRTPDGKDQAAIVDCTLDAAVLTVTQVERVHKRWPSTIFPLGEGGKEAFKPLPPNEAKEIAVAYDKISEAVEAESDIAFRHYRAFTYVENVAALCVCRGERCDGLWPRSYLQMIPAPSNPYECVRAKRVDGHWRFAPAGFR